ncbi:MBOAT family protein [Candidatus Peregrinibacteria bacterium]|nr:MBOAT family protein [Candidatus Peregrinibacteria bacterium]
MFFNTFEFFVFFLATFAAYWLLVPKVYKKQFLIGTGFVFYFIAGQFVRIFIFGLDVLVFYVGRLLYKIKDGSKRKFVFIIGLFAVVSSLVFFKYVDFLAELIEAIFNVDLPAANIVMPLGISFFTFEFIHYLTDIYFGKIKPHSFKDFLLFSFFYPTLVSGPIKRFQLFIASFQKLTIQSFFHGFLIILMGYFYKFVIADSIMPITQALASPETATQYTSVISLYAYNFRLFFDFAGYSLIAIGCAFLLGYTVPVNFNKPFIASNPSEFWKRWHMSLSSWIRDYIYIFLGGSRRGQIRTIFNLIIIMAVFGLWHGAGLNFLVWGIYHGMGLALYHMTFKKLRTQNMFLKLAGIFVTFNFVTLGWAFFATNSLQSSFIILEKIFFG